MQFGLIGIATDKLGRYRAFDICLNRIIKPAGTVIEYEPSEVISYNYNEMIRKTLANEEFKWLWILGDDHAFLPSLLMLLLERDVDVVVPLCIRRTLPFLPIIQGDKDNGFKAMRDYSWLDGKTGIVQLTDKTTGNAGMLIKRHVLEAIPPPWFEDGKTIPEMGGCDLWFCQKVMDAGFKVYLDTDNPIEHLTYVAAWPERGEDGMYHPVLRKANEHFSLSATEPSAVQEVSELPVC